MYIKYIMHYFEYVHEHAPGILSNIYFLPSATKNYLLITTLLLMGALFA